jgi:hypothetical protein
MDAHSRAAAHDDADEDPLLRAAFVLWVVLMF